MAEALAVIGLAANIAQFIEYGLKTVAAIKEAFESGSGMDRETKELKLTTEDIYHRSLDFLKRSNSVPISKDELAIQKYATECMELSDELLAVLSKLAVRPAARSKTLETGRLAFYSFIERRRLEKMNLRLKELDDHLRYRLSKVFQEGQHSAVMTQLLKIEHDHKVAKATTNSRLAEIKNEICSLVQAERDESSKRSDQLARLIANLTRLSNEHSIRSSQVAIINSLYFPELKRRHGDIQDAYNHTNDWLFDSEKTSFLLWLTSQTGIYWIRGLAGSGKSTLMKYVSSHTKTSTALKQWANGSPIRKASYFFWNQGVHMQKSQVGLLQSLLYQILKALPELATIVAPKHCETEGWVLKELKEAFNKLSQQTVLSVKFCFFIDGLDEYDGDKEDIIAVLNFLSQSPDMKICASSRPWPAFEKAFQDPTRTLTVQDFTLDDMRIYATAELEQNVHFRSLASKDERCQQVLFEIAERSQGVWLWVFFVTRDLKRAVNGMERYSALRKVLDSFPRQLEAYFESILTRLEMNRSPIYRQEMCRIFLLTVDTLEPLPLFAFHLLQQEYGDPDYAIKQEIRKRDDKEVASIHDEWQLLMHTRCGDLLTIHCDNSAQWLDRYRVDFLHRTVGDFLQDNYYRILKDGAGARFVPMLSLANTALSLLKTMPSTEFPLISNPALRYRKFSAQKWNYKHIKHIMHYSFSLEKSGLGSPIDILDELGHVLVPYLEEQIDLRVYLELPRASPLPIEDVALILSAKNGLLNYMKYKMDRDQTLIARHGLVLLTHALYSLCVAGEPKIAMDSDPLPRLASNLEIIEYLLDSGVDPNQSPPWNSDDTVWSWFLRELRWEFGGSNKNRSRLQLSAIRLLVNSGAKTGQRIREPSGKLISVKEVLEAILEQGRNTEAEKVDILQLIQERESYQKRTRWSRWASWMP